MHLERNAGALGDLDDRPKDGGRASHAGAAGRSAQFVQPPQPQFPRQRPPPTMGNSLSSRADKVIAELPEDERYFGLENFGNTCYCNSVLQTLYFCKPFRERVISYAGRLQSGKHGQPVKENVLTCLAELFVQVGRPCRAVWGGRLPCCMRMAAGGGGWAAAARSGGPVRTRQASQEQCCCRRHADQQPEEEDGVRRAAQVCAARQGGERAVQQLYAPGARRRLCSGLAALLEPSAAACCCWACERRGAADTPRAAVLRKGPSRWLCRLPRPLVYPFILSRTYVCVSPPHRICTPQDAHEFLNYLLNEVAEILEREEQAAREREQKEQRERSASRGGGAGRKRSACVRAVYSSLVALLARGGRRGERAVRTWAAQRRDENASS